MKINGRAMDQYRARLMARGPEGEPMSLITGSETLAELRQQIINLSQASALNQYCSHCPFQILSGLSYASLENLVNTLPRRVCLSFFEDELKCRSQADQVCCLSQFIAKPETRDDHAD